MVTKKYPLTMVQFREKIDKKYFGAQRFSTKAYTAQTFFKQSYPKRTHLMGFANSFVTEKHYHTVMVVIQR